MNIRFIKEMQYEFKQFNGKIDADTFSCIKTIKEITFLNKKRKRVNPKKIPCNNKKKSCKRNLLGTKSS